MNVYISMNDTHVIQDSTVNSIRFTGVTPVAIPGRAASGLHGQPEQQFFWDLHLQERRCWFERFHPLEISNESMKTCGSGICSGICSDVQSSGSTSIVTSHFPVFFQWRRV